MTSILFCAIFLHFPLLVLAREQRFLLVAQELVQHSDGHANSLTIIEWVTFAREVGVGRSARNKNQTQIMTKERNS